MTAPLPRPQPAKSRLLITLVIDTSDSMKVGDAIGQLNQGLRDWRQALNRQPQLRRMADVALVSFGQGGVRIIDPTGTSTTEPAQPFVSVDRFDPPALTAGGFSPVVPAIRRALSIIDRRRTELASTGIAMYYRPLVYLMTDGAPSDEAGRPSDRWRDLVPELRRQEAAKQLVFFAFGVPGADGEVLRELAGDGYHQLADNDFKAVLDRVQISIERATEQTRGQSATHIKSDIIADNESRARMLAWLERQQD